MTEIRVPEHTPEETTARFWSTFYAKSGLKRSPSPFAIWCLEEQLAAGSRILELGCGNGRDSFAFMENGLPVLAIDGCGEAIAANRALCPASAPKNEETAPELDFFLGEFAHLDFRNMSALPKIAARWFRSDSKVTTVYSRFVLHAVSESVEDGILDFCEEHLPAGCRMLHEFRTVRDPLMQQGTVLSENERLTDHYRRFLDPDAFRAKLERRGWRERFFVESDGLAVFGNDNPVVARIVVER